MLPWVRRTCTSILLEYTCIDTTIGTICYTNVYVYF